MLRSIVVLIWLAGAPCQPAGAAPAAPAAPYAVTAPLTAGARLAASCAACHGTAAATVGAAVAGAAPLLPPLAGQTRDTLLASLRAFRDGSRPATIMTQIARGYSDEQLALLAAYFATQRQGG